MHDSVAIRRLSVKPLNLPLHAPFGIAGGAQDLARNLLVEIELADGTLGLGEAAPFPAYNGETQAQAARVLADAAAWLPAITARHPVGLDNWRGLAEEFSIRGGSASGSARCGFETALLDALTRRASVTLERFFGGAGQVLITDMTVTTGSPEESAAAVRKIRALGIRTVKVKVGGPRGPAHDLARLASIHEAAPDSPLIIDGNAGLARAQATELVRGLRALGVTPALLEQWLAPDDLEGAAALAKESGWLLAADEAARTAADVPKLAASGAAQLVNIKIMKSGLAAALDLAAAARAHGLGLMIGGNVESRLAMTTSACLASGLGGFSFVDLDTPLFLSSDPFEGGMEYALDRISLAKIRAGHGLSVRPGHELPASCEQLSE
ncbi:MAG: hypothetical protein MUE42_04525 [Opitutaceae bacterium]|jgi:L-alanine-DL-glutamate epimerase-like enolase superfamily enzyme|nr:hypothetical protein [Opitutaceae bacterium]